MDRGDDSTNHLVKNPWQNVLSWLLAIGLFIQISGKVWIESGSARNTQVYLWLLLPALILIVTKLMSRRKPEFSWHYIPWLLFLAWVSISTLWATGSETGAFSLAKRGALIALYILAIYSLISCNERFFQKSLMTGVAVVSAGALATIIYQLFFLDQPLAYRAFRLDRLGIGDFADYGWPVAAGIFHGAIATWALGFALDRRTRFNQALVWLSVFVILSAYVLLTYTRGAWIALLFGVAAVVVLQNSRRGWISLAVGAVVLLLLVVYFWTKIVFEFQQRQLSGREPIWIYYFQEMVGHWLIGHGLGTPFQYHWPDGKSVSPHAHSLYLQQVYDSGIVSIMLFGTGLLGLCHKAWRFRSNYWVRLAFPALVFALIAMLTDVERIFTRPGDYWTVFWLPVAVLLSVPSRACKAKKTL
ncbi:MAG: O-antigen ligase family protein [Pseudomonas palmensis]|uniref:O-antigen ligase family protein n=1 Tax=Pseudomonas palmensis TaxID=2815362 RepID=UPI003D1105D4